jgi:hypothetical protein
MKKIVLNLIIIGTVSFVMALKMDAQINGTFIGNWNFECLLAPAGFNEGLIEIQTDSVFAMSSDMKYRVSSSWIKMKNDTLIFNVDINGEMVLCRLLAVGDNKLTGTAGSMEDESPLILTKKADVPYYSSGDLETRP